MKTVSHYKKIAKKFLRDRYKHSKSVALTAGTIATIFNEDREKAEIAGLLHDWGKALKDKEFYYCLTQIKGYENIEYTTFIREAYNFLHAEVSAQYIMRFLNVSDREIIDAVLCHTYGKAEMTRLEKIVFIADVIEPRRGNTRQLNKMRYYILNKHNINRAMIVAVNDKIRGFIKRNREIPLELIEMRNGIISEIEGDEKCEY